MASPWICGRCKGEGFVCIERSRSAEPDICPVCLKRAEAEWQRARAERVIAALDADAARRGLKDGDHG